MKNIHGKDLEEEMATEIVLTDGAADWLKEILKNLQDDWCWSSNPKVAPTLDDTLYLREIMRELNK